MNRSNACGFDADSSLYLILPSPVLSNRLPAKKNPHKTTGHPRGDSNVESLNILNYPVKAEYTPHYDWGADGQIESRFLSGLIYLNEPEAGTMTSP